jgi:HAD superfamily hydrolase (TIGR01509 family)
VSRFQLVVFDCDGVLVDSERPANEVFRLMLNDLGLNLSLDDMFEHFVGLSMPQCMTLVTDLLGAPPPADFLPVLKRRISNALSAVSPIHGVPELLRNLSVPFCVASNGEPEDVKLSLHAAGLYDLLGDKIFCACDVARPKPAPDLYVHAAQRLGVPVAHCAVVEDTPTGVRAAVAAGMHVFGFAGSTPEWRLREAGAHAVLDAMASLPAHLEHMGARD